MSKEDKEKAGVSGMASTDARCPKPKNPHLGQCVGCKKLLPKKWLYDGGCAWCDYTGRSSCIMLPPAWESSQCFFVEAVHEICKRMKPSEGIEDLEKLAKSHEEMTDDIIHLADRLERLLRERMADESGDCAEHSEQSDPKQCGGCSER